MRLVTELRDREIIGSVVTLQLCDKGCCVGSDEVLHSRSYLYSKLNGKRVSDQRSNTETLTGGFSDQFSGYLRTPMLMWLPMWLNARQSKILPESGETTAIIQIDHDLHDR